MAAVIELRGVCKSFGAVVVLEDIDLDVLEGEIITIIGGSGAGKSVLLKLMLGVLKPSMGVVRFCGCNVAAMSEEELVNMRKNMGVLFQGAALFDSLTVFENVAYPIREHYNYDEERVAQIVTSKLELVGLSGVESMMPADLSGGMKKRVGLARAIAADPKIILYDEPTTGLDPANVKRINALILELRKKLGVTSVVVTHDMDSAFVITDRLALLYDHRIRFVGTKEEAVNSHDEVVKGFIEGNIGGR